MKDEPGRSVERIARAGIVRAAQDLRALCALAERLDPASIVAGESPAAYLARCRANEPALRAVVERLRRERPELDRDVLVFDAESSALAVESRRLEAILAGDFPDDPDGLAERARLTQSLAVCTQGLLALAAARDGARSLAAVIDRATSATASAIRIAQVTARAVERRGAAFDLAAKLAAVTGADADPSPLEHLGRAFDEVRSAAAGHAVPGSPMDSATR